MVKEGKATEVLGLGLALEGELVLFGLPVSESSVVFPTGHFLSQLLSPLGGGEQAHSSACSLVMWGCSLSPCAATAQLGTESAWV